MRPITPLLAISAAAVGATIFTCGIFTIPSRAAEGPPDAANVPALPEPSSGEDVGNGTEVLTRGPVHEAYATPVEFNPQPGPVIKKEPPPAIEEVPPDQRPEGDNVVWIPGYFAWDEERQDFLWVSGVWRNVPPGQTWVAGYWNKADEGFQWTPGFWTGAKKQEVAYVNEAPPATLEAGPTSPQPSDNHFWIPGNWAYQDHYVWQPGYWAVQQSNWVWVPAHWMWTPGGFVFVGGFWDYVPAYRGCLFAPVYFSAAVYARPHFVWCPGIVINTGFFSANLFFGPAHRHYYFGDFYAERYAGLGFRPWFEIGVGQRVGYDPLFAYARWRNSRTDPNWLAQQQQHFQMLQKNAADRPPRTFAAQEQLLKKDPGAEKRPGFMAATTLAQAAKEPNVTGFKLQNVSQQNRREMLNQADSLNKFSKERLELEKQNTTTGTTGETGRGAAGSATTMNKLKLPTVGAMSNKGATGGAQTLSQQSGQQGEQGSRTGGRFNRQMAGATGQDQPSGSTGKPTLGDKNVQSSDQIKTFNPGRPFGLNKANDDDKTSDQNPSRNMPIQRGSGSPLTQPFGEQNSQGSGKQNMTVQGPAGGVDADQGGSGKANMTVMPQGQGGGQGLQRGGGRSQFVNPQGGGQQRTTTPSNSQSKKDKDKDDNTQQQQRNNKSSDTTPPSTDFTMRRQQTLPLNVKGVATAEKEAMQRDITGRSENLAKEVLNDKLTNDNSPPPIAKPNNTNNPNNTNKSQPQTSGLTGPNAPGAGTGLKAPGVTEKPIPQGYGTNSGGMGNLSAVPEARSIGNGTPPSPESMSIYRNLQQRGRTLSQPAVAGQTASATGGDNGGGSDPDARLKKDPVGSYSYGSSPTRYPGIAAPYGAGGQAAATRTAAPTSGTLGAGLGAMQKYTPGKLPTLDRAGYGNSYGAPVGGADAGSRSYDPSQQSTNSYGER